MAIFQRVISDATSTNQWARSGMPMMQHIGEFTLRAGNRYLDVKTNFISGSAMLSFYYWGYLYNRGTIFGHAGCYLYSGTDILNKYIYNTGSTTLSNIYKIASPNYMCFKFDSGNDGYTEGRINIFIASHSLDLGAVGIIEYAQNNTASSYYS
jgi:hypothetical protein